MIKNIDVIDTKHQDIIHDISFDFYSKRLATCSGDQQVKIYEKQQDGSWIKTCEFSAHDAPVLRVKWAHPDFGNILATCSSDKSVQIWEEKKIIKQNPENHELIEASEWQSKYKILDTKDSVEDIKFAPRHLGLQIGVAFSDGVLKIYEQTDLLNLNYVWETDAEIKFSNFKIPYEISAISWCKNQYYPPMIAIGCKDKQQQQRQLQNIMIQQQSQQQQQSAKLNIILKRNQNEDQNKQDNIEQSIDQYLCIFAKTKESDYQLLSLPNLQRNYHKSGIIDVSWAQLNGRSFDLLATCGQDGVFVWKIRLNEDIDQLSLSILNIINLNNQDLNQIGAWKVSWNIMATILAASYEDNVVRLWKNAGIDKFVCLGAIKEDQNQQQQNQNIIVNEFNK